MAYATDFVRHGENRAIRFTDDMFELPRNRGAAPAKHTLSPDTCPYCEQVLPHARTSILSMFRGAICRFVAALWMLVAAVIRCVRFAVAAVLCTIGLVGACCRALGLRIAHPHDRGMLSACRRPSH